MVKVEISYKDARSLRDLLSGQSICFELYDRLVSTLMRDGLSIELVIKKEKSK